MRLTCARSMSQMGHEHGIEGTGGVSGPPPIAAKSARFGYGPVPGRCRRGRFPCNPDRDSLCGAAARGRDRCRLVSTDGARTVRDSPNTTSAIR
jgi:hypothetical protein